MYGGQYHGALGNPNIMMQMGQIGSGTGNTGYVLNGMFVYSGQSVTF